MSISGKKNKFLLSFSEIVLMGKAESHSKLLGTQDRSSNFLHQNTTHSAAKHSLTTAGTGLQMLSSLLWRSVSAEEKYALRWVGE